MLIQLKIYHKFLNLVSNILVKGRSVPENPVSDLGLHVSSHIMYVLPYASRIELLTLRMKCLEHNLPDPLKPLIIDGIELPRYIIICNKQNKFTTLNIQKEELINDLFHKYLNLYFKNLSLNIEMIPVFVIFRRFRNHQKNGVSLSLRILRCIQKLISIIRLSRDSCIQFSEPISLQEIAKRYATDKAIIKKLIRAARVHFSRQFLSILGPPLLSKQDLFNKLLTSKTIISIIKDEACRKKISLEKSKENAISLMREIAANISHEMIYLTDIVLSLTWNYLYQKINVHNIECVHKLARNGHTIVYVPCHRSHMDYLLLSYVLYQHGLVPPHIAAGINLNFWPIGSIFRRLGAFFIRRTFTGDKFYSAIFREYLSELFRHGYSIEYFIEGGRSRTGCLLNPKTGTLSMTIQAALRSRTRPMTIIPVYIGYEYIMEVNTYAKELQGAMKEKESFLGMLCSLRRLRNFGHSYVNFGEPLLLTTWLNQHVPDWYKSINQMRNIRPTWLTPAINRISVELMIRINNAVAINAMNLCCTALLASHHLLLTRKQLTEQLNCYLDLMRNVLHSTYSTVPIENADVLIDHALRMNKFKIKKETLYKGTINDLIILPREQVALLTYYRNNIIHILVLPSLIATIIIKYRCVSPQKLLIHVNTLYPILKSELFLQLKRDKLKIELDRLTNELLRQNLIILKDNEFQINPSRYYTLKLLADGVREILQRYAIIFWLLNTNPNTKRSLLEQRSRALSHQLSLVSGINVLACSDKSAFNAFFLTLRKEGYIVNSGNLESKTIKVYLILAELITSDARSTIENTNLV